MLQLTHLKKLHVWFSLYLAQQAGMTQTRDQLSTQHLGNLHWWARLLDSNCWLPFIICHFCLQQENRSLPFSINNDLRLVPFSVWRHGDMEINYWGIPDVYVYLFIYAATIESGPSDFSKSVFTIYTSRKQNFVVCPFLDEETNIGYLFANRLNGLTD
jgi:hypothetical protein